MISVSLIYAIILVGPGVVFGRIIGFSESRFFSSVVAALLIVLCATELSEWIPISFENLYLFFVLPASGAFFLLQLSHPYLMPRGVQKLVYPKNTLGLVLKKSMWGKFAMLSPFFLSLMVLWVLGPYSELPADVWQHLENIRLEKSYLESGSSLARNSWYTFNALVWFLSGADFEEFFRAVSFLNSAVILLAVFQFTASLSRASGMRADTALVAGNLSVWCFILFFGLGPFSYLRYYAFSPSFPAYCLFLAAVLACSNLISANRGSGRGCVSPLLTVGVCGLLAFFIHKQESLFIAVTVSASLIWIGLRRLTSAGVKGKMTGPQESYRSVVFVIVVVCIVTLFGVGVSTLLPEVRISHRDFFNLGAYFPALEGIYLFRLQSQFFEAVGLLGLIALLLVGSAKGKKVGLEILWVLTVGVLVFTLNPITNRYFELSVGSEVTWRLAYAIPTFAIVALSVCVYWDRSCTTLRSIDRIRLVPAGMAILLFIVLSPHLGNYSLTAKKFTLKPTSSGASYVHWADLIGFMNEVQGRRDLLTDPITGYFLTSTTQHRHRRWKFHKKNYEDFNKPGYSESSFRDHRGWLVVVNQRVGAASELGRVSGHWSESVLQLDQHYTNEFLEYASTAPHFKRIWDAPDIVVYEIQ